MRGNVSKFVRRTLRRAGLLPYFTSPDRVIVLDYPVHPRPRDRHGKQPHGLLYRHFDADRDRYDERLRSFQRFEEDLARIPIDARGTPDLAWLNGWLGELDAVALYALLCQINPKTYVEIGSGYSTMFARRAIVDHQLRTRILSLDPQPRTEVNTISDEVIRRPLEEADLGLFDRLEPGDVVFFDGSHRCFTNSDVTVFFLEVFPQLPKDIFVQVHDIFLPYDYPLKWNGRFYSEQYVLAALILGGCRFFDVILPHQFIVRDPDLPRALDSLWLRLGLSERIHLSKSFWMKTKSADGFWRAERKLIGSPL